MKNLKKIKYQGNPTEMKHKQHFSKDGNEFDNTRIKSVVTENAE